MKKRLLFLLIVAGLFSIHGHVSGQAVSAGIADTNVYFNGQFLELGINNMGALGAPTPPTGYHPYPAGPLAAVYDAGHDGWTVGMPPFMGDYTWPGSPFEGWEIQINGTARSQAFTTGLGSTIVNSTPAGAGMSGHSGLYSDAGGTFSTTWTGIVGAGGALAISQVTSMDSNGSVMYVTTTLHNTGAVAVPAVYYFRSCDGDNDETRPGGSFATDNTILHQNEDASHRVESDEEGEFYHNHWSLCTKDCRAKAVIYTSWPLASTVNLANLWSGTGSGAGTTQYTLGGTLDGDYAEGMVFKIGNIAAGATAVISYAYVFSDTFSTIDIAFPDPQLLVAGTATDSVDTFNTCSYPGMTTLPVSITHGTTGEWTSGHWTWAPTTGLLTDTGVINTVALTSLTVPITYTITGTDSSIGSCAMKTFYLTILPCFTAANNGPICENDTLKLFAFGDSTGATYSWYNAAGVVVSTSQNPVFPNAPLSDSGVYMVTKTVGAVSDTAYTDVIIKPLPTVSLSTDAPVCSGTTLTLGATLYSAGETYSWTGPLGFSSPLSNPVIFPAYTANSGVYSVTVQYNGCFNTAAIIAIVDSTPEIPVATSNSILCSDSTLLLYATDATGGVTYSWSGPGLFVSGVQNPSIADVTVAASGEYTVVATLNICSSMGVTDVTVYPTPPAPVVVPVTPVCSGAALNLAASDTIGASPGATYTWVGPNGFTSTLAGPAINPVSTAATGIYSVYATLGGCPSVWSTVAVLIDSTPLPVTVGVNSPICQGDTLYFTANTATAGVTYSWTSSPVGFTSTLQNPVIYNAPVSASGLYSVSATLNGLCFSSADTAVVVNVIPTLNTIGSTSPICSGTNLTLFATFAPDGGIYNWSGPLGYTSVGSAVTVPGLPTTASGFYYVNETLNGCISATDSTYVVIDSTPEIPYIFSNSAVCKGDTLKLISGDNTLNVTYSWSGPNGFTSTEENPMIDNVPDEAQGDYTVTVSLVTNGVTCSNFADTMVNITDTPSFTPTNNGPVCTGDTLILHANGAPGSHYTWAGPYAYFAATALSDPSLYNVSLENAGVYTVTAFLNGCYHSETDTVVINTTPLPPFISWLTYCQYYPAPALQATGTNIQWYLADSVQSGIIPDPVPQTTVVGSSFYFATQTVNGCISAIDSIQVTVNPTPTVTVSPSDTGVCPHTPVVLTASDADPIAYYHWYPGIYLNDTNTAVVTANPEGNETYHVVASNQFGCADTASVNIVVFPAAVISLGDSVILYPGDTYTMNPLTNCAYFTWYPPTGLSNAYISNPVVTPLVSTKYQVNGQTTDGCVTSDSISIYVNAESVAALPNAFTPGAGGNSMYKINTKGVVSLTYFRIFDRWGIKVFETSDINGGWDGNYNGKPQPFGVYVYEVQGKTAEGQDVLLQGNLTLLR